MSNRSNESKPLNSNDQQAYTKSSSAEGRTNSKNRQTFPLEAAQWCLLEVFIDCLLHNLDSEHLMALLG